MTEFEDWIKKKEARRSRIKGPKLKRKVISHAKPKRIRSKRKTGFSEETRQQAHDRSSGHCQNPLCGKRLPGLGGEHHCLPRSQYKKADRNDLWNCAAICQECHHRVTVLKTEEDKRLRRYFERLAIARRDLPEAELLATSQQLERSLRDNTLELNRQFQLFTK